MDSTFSFWKNLLFMAVFFTVAPITLGLSVFAMVSLNKTDNPHTLETPKTGIKVFASLPNVMPRISQSFEIEDARSAILTQYFIKYKSPLVSLSDYLVEMADKNDLDFRLLPAIAQQESNLCKIIPEGTYNCWGWGIHSRGTLGFESYEEAISTVMEGLKKEYIDKGYTTPDTIWKKYTPGSPDGAWAKGVNQFMADMQ
jgi:hypothetical protein